jgi:hypothetical protein
MAAAGGNGHLANPVSGVDNMELDNGQPMRSRRCEHGCGRRWLSGVTASYSRDTDEDEVQRNKELTMMGRRTRKAQCTTLYVCDCNKKRSLAKASIDPRFASLLDPEDLEVMSTDQERISDG